jgi:hypothetical protein
MDTMYDDGFDLVAPPEPPIELTPQKLVGAEEHDAMLWFTPIVLVLSTIVSLAFIWGLFRFLK